MVVVAIVALPVAWWMSAGVRGNLRARYDVARGRYVIHLYGLPAATFPEYQQLLRERYGVEVRAMGCILPLSSYDDSYDRVVIAAANRRFGRDVFKEALDQANKDWELKHKAELELVSHSE
ncbi:MAG: hypothetical protein ABSA54_08740 [Terriglobales bacterium]